MSRSCDPQYPQTVSEILDDRIRFRRATIQAVLRLKESHPWKGTFAERKAKFHRLHKDLCRIYGKHTRLRFRKIDGGRSDDSSYNEVADVITLRGKLSVITYLHEFSHALGRNERGSCRWSVNLFKRCFPKQFSRCGYDGHLVRSQRRQT